MVWLTGGAIVTCLAMIVGLLVLILWCGLPTFWPAPLVQVTSPDGRVVLGEVTRSESFRLTPANLNNLTTADSTLAVELLGNQPFLNTRRRLFRTGNFELTNEHFQWVYDLGIPPGGETHPEWAVTVERLEWGRFYGQPQRFTLHHPRTPGTAELDLVAIQQFLESNRWRLAPEQVEAFDAAVQPLATALQSARSESVQALLAQFPDDRRQRCEAILEDGQAIPLADCQPHFLVQEIRETWSDPKSAWERYQAYHGPVLGRSRERRDLERNSIGLVNRRVESARLAIRKQELRHDVQTSDLAVAWKNAEMACQALQEADLQIQGVLAKLQSQFPQHTDLRAFAEQFARAQRDELKEQRREPAAARDAAREAVGQLPPAVAAAIERAITVQTGADQETALIHNQITRLNDENARYELTMRTADGQEKPLSLGDIVRAFPANQLTWMGRLQVYLARWQEFLIDEPREANSEGGVFPAIWGTVVMTLVMSLMVVPFGVLAALYMREYARAGLIVSAIRISISNLAGVPSIVFGVFGLGFFCYLCGSFVDGGPLQAGFSPLPPPAWWLGLIGLALCGVAAFSCALVNLTRNGRRAGRWRPRSWLGYASITLWLATVAIAAVLILRSPYFSGSFAAELPNPTFGKGGLLWASLTLALLTLPVVIVATEEAISAVPNSLREGSFACGASKWQTIRRIVLPHALPGIMTGMILAMARGAGEVAPLMLVGAVKLAPDLPIDTTFPFVHFDRSFMHLGFHIFDVGFQSQNSEAAKPMVFTTTLLLIVIIATLNFTAIWIRSRLRRRALTGQF